MKIELRFRKYETLIGTVTEVCYQWPPVAPFKQNKASSSNKVVLVKKKYIGPIFMGTYCTTCTKNYLDRTQWNQKYLGRHPGWQMFGLLKAFLCTCLCRQVI